MSPTTAVPAASPELRDVLCAVFVLSDFQQLVLYSLGEPLANFVDEHRALPAVAFDLLGETDRRGVTELLLRAAVQARPARPDLRDVVGRVCPAALAQPAEARDQVQVVGRAVTAVQARLADERVRRRVADSRDKLAAVAGQIDQLERYKRLHECLHVILFRYYHQIADTARRFKTDPLASDTLADYITDLQGQARTARAVIGGLPAGPIGQGLELPRVADLDTAAGELATAREQLNELPAGNAVRRLKRVLAFHPIRINQALTTIAAALPLGLLAETLAAAASATEADKAADPIRFGEATLRALHPRLLARVAEHTAWQQAENDLWRAEDDLYQQTADARDEFVFLWPGVQAELAALAALDPSAEWVAQLARCAAAVTASLAAAAPGGDFPDRIRLAFKDYRRSAMLRFFAVDDGLRALCSEVVALGGPIRDLLQEVTHAP
jgi:hypothetical protein